MVRRTARSGYTLLEILAVLAILVILGAVIVPTLPSYYGNTRQKAAADGIRARLADARSKAMEKGTWYRLAIHQDGTRVRLAPDGPDFASLAADETPSPDSVVTEDKFEDGVTAEFRTDSDDQLSNTSGWLTVATVGPDGTCKEDGAVIVVKEKNFAPIQIRVRGLTGTASVGRPQKNGGQP